jgi:hypothetical protein
MNGWWTSFCARMSSFLKSAGAEKNQSVPDDDLIARFVLQSNLLNKENAKKILVKPNAFLPQPLSSVEVSVYRIRDWSEREIQHKGIEVADERESNHRKKILAKGQSYPADKRTFKHLGRGQLIVADVRATSLDVVAKEPPLRHADIVGWPRPVGLNKKDDEAAQLLYAQMLASKCVFFPAI